MVHSEIVNGRHRLLNRRGLAHESWPKSCQKIAKILCKAAPPHIIGLLAGLGLERPSGHRHAEMPPGKCLPRYRFADLIVDEGRRAVTRGTSDIRLPRLSFELLRTLVEAAPNIVSNDELSRAVWHGVIVGPETVTQRVKLVRDALGDDPEAPRYIAGLRGQGYRILQPVTMESEFAA